MGNKGVILLVEDNMELNISNSRVLRLRGHTVLTAETLAQAREQLLKQEPDIILLDVMLPDGNGFDFCAETLGNTSAHILFLTAKTAHEEMVRGLMGGGDDYITKPFHPEALLARVDAAMRRRKIDKITAQVITKGTLTLDVVSSRALMGGTDLCLTPREFSLLILLAQNEGKTISAEDLYEKAWKAPLAEDKNTLQATISKLRKKIESSGYGVATSRGQGYIFAKI